ncbi:protoheme IX farnesyltransferase [Budviciaceae bacterium BWR-B9]|uniref:Protoheme IX farnesyltransferase n=1 Tax=Limnobaculum allomyrinae TaxID=2791986 RepID=A0ABS1IRB8_9GAMM|nr:MULTISPECIES: heme o synthase [Limnobaculum]MBK5144300.1 protoheme IX farnesyltransferase [Limnobaculum allomyrinae]MBV7691955.1 heme o synthase [Limnobaculum sp. M2-1]
MIKKYLLVTKPGIIFGNMISVIGGFLLASQGSVDFSLLFATIIGVSLVVASGCVFNNYIDRDIDCLMERTKNRVLVQGLISPAITILYACLLGIAGFALLYTYTNLLAVEFALLGFVVYVGLYSLYLKRKSVYGTLVGSLSGAAPPVIGYCAVSNQFDTGALILLVIFSLWQMPHSYAIAIFRYKDYLAASIPVLPVKRGISVTKNHITLYIIGFIVATLMLTISGYAGYSYLFVAAVVGFGWLIMALTGYKTTDNKIWARKLFIFSIVAITTLSIMMSVDYSQVAAPESLLTFVWP